MTATTNPSRRTGPSLGTRVFLVTFVLIALSVGTAVAVTSFLVRRIARDAAREALASASSVQEIVQGRFRDRLKQISSLVVSDPYLAAYVAQATGEMDSASILDLLTTKQQDLGFDFAIFLDPSGKVVAHTNRLNAVGRALAGQPLVTKALADYEAEGVWEEDGRLYYAVVVPLQRDFTLLGFMVTGLAITEAAAREIHDISGADVAFVAGGAQGPQVVATTLPKETARSLSEALGSRGDALGRALQAGQKAEETEIELDGEPWIGVLSPLAERETRAEGRPVGATIALASLRKELGAYREIETVLIVAGLASALLGGLLAFALARRTLAPLRQLGTAAEAARQGDYDQKISTGRTDEVGRLAQAFDDLLGDLREKRDMEAYVTELSRNLPEPAQGRAVVGQPQTRDVLVMGIDLRRYARATANGGPQEALERLTEDLKRVTTAVGAQRGQLEGVTGHRVLASFAGDARGRRALQAAAQVLTHYVEGADSDPESEEQAPAVALAAGKAVTGPVTINEQMERALVGLPVQQIDGLLREATPGELLLSREVHEELRASFEQAGYQLAQRRGVVSPQPLYVVTASLAARLSGLRGIGALDGATVGGRSTVTPAGVQTLSGIAPGALMGQRFEILSVLGAGGMGVVYKARDRELDDLVALKMLKKDQLVDRTQIERLKSEIKLARKITHPNVLRTYDFGEIDGIPYISMEYVRGVTLRYMLDQNQTKRLPYSAGLRLAKQLCAGLAAAHAVGVLHRDIKPENLILEPTGNAKLMDFGIARPINRMEPGQTQAGMIVGTPLYLSPELLQGQDADPRSDIYSCGVVLYEIFAGVLPFEGANAMEIMLKHLREQPASPRVHAPEIPPKLEQAILRCLAKEPGERYRSVQDLLRDLETLSA